MANEDLSQEIELMWEAMRADDEMIVDFPGSKLGMPFGQAYEVIIPWECDGVFLPVSINPESIPKLIAGLLSAQKSCIELTDVAEAEYHTHEAIQKAAGATHG